MEGRVNYAVVGIFVVVLSAFLFTFVIWMSVVGHGVSYRKYVVYVHEDVTGLSVESPVRFNGVKVGYVGSIQLDKDNPKLVELILQIQSDVRITTNTYAILHAQGITGVVYVNLKADSADPTLLVAAANQPYPVIPARPSLLMQLSTVLPELTKDVQKLSANIGDVLDAQNRESIKNSLQNIAIVTKTLAANSHDFTDTMHSLDNLLANTSEASNHLPLSVKQLNQTLRSVDQLSIEMKQTSQTIQKTMQSGQTAIRNFATQVMPNAESALSNLSQVSFSVSQLTKQLQRNPSMLIRGTQPASPGPGEK